MSATVSAFGHRGTTSSVKTEIVRELVNASDGAGLHFDGSSGNIDIASPPDLGAFAVYINNEGGYSTGATSIEVDALKAEIPSGTILTFSGGGQYPVTTTAAAGAETIVSTLGLSSAAVVDDEGAAYGGANKFSHEFVIKADEDLTTGSSSYIIDYEGGSGRFILGFNPAEDSGNFAIYDKVGWKSFGVNPLTDLKVHHIVVTVDGTSAVLYDNGNQVGTATINANHGINNATDAAIGSNFFTATSNNFEGVIYRFRTYNKSLTSAEVQTAFERADVPVVDQYGTTNAPFTSINLSSGWSTVATGSSIVDSDSFSTTSSGSGVSYPLTIGKRYRVTWNVSGSAYNSIRQYTPSEDLVTISTATSGTAEFTAEKNTLYIRNGGAGTTDITWMSLVQIGAVVDMDLAFANPTQSRTVQDRSGAADGTCSASGVTQVQKLVQANVERLAVGGTTPRVGVGLGADVLPSNPLHIESSSEQILLQGAASGASSQTAKISFSNSGQNSLDISTQYPSPGSNTNEISLTPGGTTKSLVVKGGSGSATGPFMTIDSDGLATFANGIAFPAPSPASAGTPAASSVLDVYETGTWTPTLPNGGTLVTGMKTYTRIGNLCTIHFYVSSVAPSANSSRFEIGGLPFTISNDANYYPAGTIGYCGDGDFHDAGLVGLTDQNSVYFHTLDGSTGTLSNNQIISRFSGSTDALICTLTYKVK